MIKKMIRMIASMLFFILIVFLLLFIYARFIEPALLVTTQIELKSPRITQEADGLRIVQFSDTHLSRYYTTQRLARAVRAINREKPDLVFFTGDLIDRLDSYDGDTAEISRILADIEATIGKYAVYGNHDYGAGAHAHYEDIMSAGGFTVLVNRVEDFPALGLSVVGMDDFLLGHGSVRVLNDVNAARYNLVLCHEPDVLDYTLYTEKVDTMFAGHSHGGQVNLPFVSRVYSYYPHLGEKYIRGLYETDSERGSRLYVNRGLGMTKLPFRFMAVPELTVFTLRRDAQD